MTITDKILQRTDLIGLLIGITIWLPTFFILKLKVDPITLIIPIAIIGTIAEDFLEKNRRM